MCVCVHVCVCVCVCVCVRTYECVCVDNLPPASTPPHPLLPPQFGPHGPPLNLLRPEQLKASFASEPTNRLRDSAAKYVARRRATREEVKSLYAQQRVDHPQWKGDPRLRVKRQDEMELTAEEQAEM